MKILQYNWVDYAGGSGGGVTVYLRNLFESKLAEDHELVFLSAGQAYNALTERTYWRPMRPAGTSNKNRYELVNSPVISPALVETKSPLFQPKYDTAVAAIIDFLKAKGPFDIIHFHNLEGFPVYALPFVREHCKGARMFFSAHNYYPLCPQVNFWDYRVNENCRDFDGGKRCQGCNLSARTERKKKMRFLNEYVEKNRIVHSLSKNRILSGFFLAILSPIFLMFGAVKFALSPGRRDKSRTPDGRDYYAVRREVFVKNLNECFDTILCVSNRVREIYRQYGVDAAKLRVNYIGTRHAPIFHRTDEKKGPVFKDDGRFNIAYLGYARHDKGFFFLLDALEWLPESTARKIGVIIAAAFADKELLDRLRDLKGRFKFVKHHQGYSHGQLDQILQYVSVGLVPSLWEDNLPQVAIEMHSRRIPLLCSDLGGARELANCEEFTFRNNDIYSFVDALEGIMSSGITHEQYMKKAMAPVAMSEHIEELTGLYASDANSAKSDDPAGNGPRS